MFVENEKLLEEEDEGEFSLDRVRDSALAQVPSCKEDLYKGCRYLKFPPKLTISDWADQNRILVGQDSPVRGKWVTDDAPYEKEPMDVLGDPFIEQTVLMWASQTGKTAGCILNTVGYYVDIDPGPMMIVYDTVGRAEDFSKQRLAPMIRNCPALASKIYRTNRENSDSLLMKTYPGGMMKIGGAETPGSLAQFPIRILLLDELDRYPASTGKEGDPVALAITRTSRFESNRKIILSSTPTIKNRSRINFAYEASSQGRWQLRCPNRECEHYQQLLWRHIDYSSEPGKILARCDSCGHSYTKVKWLAQPGRWEHTFPNRKVKGYHVNAIVSPWVSWEALVEEWQEAVRAQKTGNDYLLMVFINTKLAEVWEDYSVKVEYNTLYEYHREPYVARVPDGVLCLTIGADVQDVQKRICYEVVGWGKGYESWGIEYGVLLYDPYQTEWYEVFDTLVYNRTFKFANGKGLRIKRGFIDSNGAVGPYIYRYTKPRQPRIYSCKGSTNERGFAASFTGPYRMDERYSTMWFPINTTIGKDDLMHKLLIKTSGVGYCHFPRTQDHEPIYGYDNNYFIGLTSEEKHEEIDKRGYPRLVYQKIGQSRTSNEPLDCRVYARAALEIVERSGRLETWQQPDYIVELTEDEKKFYDMPFFAPNIVKNTRNSPDLMQFNEETGKIIVKETGAPLKNPLFEKFGQIGAAKKPFDPFSDIDL